MTSWTFAYDTFDPDKERKREALSTLANGYFGTRGATPLAPANQTHYPGTYLAGVYDRAESDIEGRLVEIESLVNAPNWLPLTWRIDGGPWFDVTGATVLNYRQELDLRQGMLHLRFRVEDRRGRQTDIRERRIVHMRHEHLAGMELRIQPVNWSGEVEIRSAIDGRISNALVGAYQALNTEHLEPVASDQNRQGRQWLKVRTRQSRIEIDVATRTRIAVDDGVGVNPDAGNTAPGYVAQTSSVTVDEGDIITIEKIAAIYTSRDRAISESGLAARTAVDSAPDFPTLLQSHIDAWDLLWQRSDIRLEDDGSDTQLLVRLHLFHLLQTASEHSRDIDTGMLARGLSGEAYHGHIFWDELFVLPCLNVRFPTVSRAMLRSRYRRLDQARQQAIEAGYMGAMFPWQSGSTGREETPPLYPNPRNGDWIPDHTPLQRHIGAAIAWNVWQYAQVSGDREFLQTEGAEMLIEIARFWSSIATFNSALDRYEIHGVMGPDEFHSSYPWAETPGLSNNSYTNVMAVHTLQIALDTLSRLPAWRRRELVDQLHLTDDELARWDDITHRMRVVFLDSGELAQFEHYERLEELDWERYRDQYGDLKRLDYILFAEGDTPNRYRIAKQPDALMLFYLFPQSHLEAIFNRLGYAFDQDARRRTTEFYLQRTTLGSTLSRVVDAKILASMDRSRSWDCLQRALQSDAGDIQGGSTGEGLHLGAMGGTIAIIEQQYAGIDARDDVLRFSPALPDELHRLTMPVLYRGHKLDVTVTHQQLQVSVASAAPEPITIALGDRVQELTPETPIDWPL